MKGSYRTLFRLLVAGFLGLATVMLTLSPSRYKVDFDSVMTIWGDIFRDLDSVVRTVRISTELEVEFGDAIARDFWTGVGDRDDQSYVAAVGEKVAAQARRQDLPWTFHVVDAGFPNAWAILGGHVYVTTEMLDLMESEAELAAILGHEIAHIDLKHCVDLVQNRMILEKVGMGGIGVVLKMAEDFLRVGYSEVQEDEADRYGMLIAAKAGYNPLNAFDTFHKLYLKEEAASKPEPPAGGPETEILTSLEGALQDYFNTHPPFAGRLDALRFLLDTNAGSWNGQTFRVGKAAHASRDLGASGTDGGDDWVFSEKDADYLALRAELAHLLGRDQEASRFFKLLRDTHPNDERIEQLKALLSGGAHQATQQEVAPQAPPKKVATPTDKVPVAVKTQARAAWKAFSVGQYTKAITGLENAIAWDPEDDWALSNLAWVYATAGLPRYRRPDRAIELVSRAIRLSEESQELDTLGAVYILLGETMKAQEAYIKAISLDRTYATNLRNDLIFLGYLTPDGTGEDMVDAIAKAVENEHAPFVLAESTARIEYLITQKPKQAVAELEVLSLAYPYHTDVIRLLQKLGLANPVTRIQELVAEGKHQEAMDLARHLLEKDPRNQAVLWELSKSLFQNARTKSQEGQLEAAIAHYTGAIDLRNGRFASALNNRALAFAKLDQTYRAMADIQKAIALDPGNSLYLANRCLFLRLRGQIWDALDNCNKAFDVGLPDNRANRSWVYLQRGTVRREANMMGAAVADYQAAVKLADIEVVKRIQKMMTTAGLYSGATDGSVNDALLTAVETCIRSPACFAMASAQLNEVVDFLQ